MTKNQKKIRRAALWAARHVVGEKGFALQVGGVRRLNLIQARGIAFLKIKDYPYRSWTGLERAAFDAARDILAKAGMK